MRKFFAWIEVLAAVVLAVSSVVGYTRVQFDATVDLVQKLSMMAGDYRQVVINGKNSFEAAWKTVPHWREALTAGQRGVAGIKITCDACAEKIWVPEGRFYPNFLIDACRHLKQIPQDFSESCQAINRGLAESIQILDKSMSESEYQKTLQAFNNTIASLEAAEQGVSGIQRDIKNHSLIFLIVMLAMSVCFFSNGIVCILEKKNGPAERS